MGLLGRIEERLAGWLRRAGRLAGGGRLTRAGVGQELERLLVAARREGEPAPNRLSARLNPADLTRLEPLESLRAEVVERLRETIDRHGWPLVGRPAVELLVDPSVPLGQLVGEARIEPGPGPGQLARRDGRAGPWRLTAAAVIGRDPTAEVTLPDEGVSRHHARVEPAVDHWRIVDLGSTNGTRVEGRTVGVERLRDGCTIVLGPVALLWREL